jgi:hypothetical protein
LLLSASFFSPTAQLSEGMTAPPRAAQHRIAEPPDRCPVCERMPASSGCPSCGNK